MFLKNLESIRHIEYARTYLWDIKFLGAPYPFSAWFPANEVTEPIATVGTESFTFDYVDIEVPAKTSNKKLNIKFYDDIGYSLQDWLREWMESLIDVNGGYSGVTPLMEACKELYIAKLTPDRTPLKVTNYTVFPVGTLTDVSNSSSGLKIYSLDFVVAGWKNVEVSRQVSKTIQLVSANTGFNLSPIA